MSKAATILTKNLLGAEGRRPCDDRGQGAKTRMSNVDVAYGGMQPER